jgi:hypothetical protein
MKQLRLGQRRESDEVAIVFVDTDQRVQCLAGALVLTETAYEVHQVA